MSLHPLSTPSSTSLHKKRGGCLILISVALCIGFLVYVIFWGLMNAPSGSNNTLNTGIYQKTSSSQENP